MKHELIERTVRDWVRSNPQRGARTLDRLTSPGIFAARTTDEIAEALIQLAGRMHIADNRAW